MISRTFWKSCGFFIKLSVLLLLLFELDWTKAEENVNSKRTIRTPQEFGNFDEGFQYSLDFHETPRRNSPRAHQLARQIMLHNQDTNSGRGGDGTLPLYKQSYPGLYAHADLKEFKYEPTHPVAYGNSHHGKEGHLFLFHDGGDTSHIFRGVAHAFHHDNLL